MSDPSQSKEAVLILKCKHKIRINKMRLVPSTSAFDVRSSLLFLFIFAAGLL